MEPNLLERFEKQFEEGKDKAEIMEMLDEIENGFKQALEEIVEDLKSGKLKKGRSNDERF